MGTATDTQVLTLSQWLSPAYPVGAFAYSHGLEGAVAAGWVTTADGLRAWLRDILDAGSGRTDGVFLAAAYRARGITDLDEVDAMCRAMTSCRERKLEAEAQGAAFCKITNDVWDTGLPDLAYPVAVGAAAARVGLPQDLAARMYLQAFASNLIAAAQRLMPLGQTEGQAILHGLTGLVGQIAQDTRAGDVSTLSSTAFLAEIAAMTHETQYSRIFRT